MLSAIEAIAPMKAGEPTVPACGRGGRASGKVRCPGPSNAEGWIEAELAEGGS